MEPGQRCVDAFATLLGRFGALRQAGADVALQGPFFGVLGDADSEGTIPGCDIWDFTSNTVSRSSVVPPPTHALVGILTCRAGGEGPVVLVAESNRQSFVRGVEEGTPCAEVVAELSRRFLRLTAQRRTALKSIKPLADGVIVQRIEAGDVATGHLRYYYVAAFM